MKKTMEEERVVVAASAGSTFADALLLGKGVSVTSFAYFVVCVAAVVVAVRNLEECAGGFKVQVWMVVVVLGLAFWIAPLKEIAYAIDRIGAVRAEIHQMAPFALDLLPTLPGLLPYTDKVIENVEKIGPFIPICMQPGVKEYMLPLMPDMMPNIEILLAKADVMAPVMKELAPQMSKILPYAPVLVPHAEQLVCIVKIDGWEVLADYLDVLSPRIDRLAPHTERMAPYMKEMLPYLPILMKHVDNLVDALDETVDVLDKLMPLLPLLPAADQAGVLSQKMAFRALPKVLRRSPLSNELAGRAALSAASVHSSLLDRAKSLQNAVMERYSLYQRNKQIEDAAMAAHEMVEVMKKNDEDEFFDK